MTAPATGVPITDYEQQLWVRGPLPGMNEIISYKDRSYASTITRNGRTKRYDMYSAEKKMWTEKILAAALAQGLTPCGASYLTFFVIEPNRRRDPDNLVSGAMKFILDALVKGKYLHTDSWVHILGYIPYWEVGDMPGVSVFFRPDRVLTREECNHGQREVDFG